MTLRTFAVATDGTYAKVEVDRMIDEKAKAFVALQALLFTGALGFSRPDIAAKSVAHYRETVRANRRRLIAKIG